MKAGTRALGVAESFRGDRSTLAGVVVRADRVVDGVEFASCAVGGTDATERVLDLWTRLDREDVRFVFLAGVAPAWYNVLDLRRIHDAVDRPVLAVSFEASTGLEAPLREHFDGDELTERLERYDALPDRRPVSVNDETVYVRALGDVDAERVVTAYTPEGGRPEPLRVARLTARAGDRYVAGER
ncbi:endonuclease dU [Halocalculus aciditolerans]|uniref:UPF0215 protein GCM10009039_03470 n=1 Tax=Halocalculus aciditolerans TaxID=1383812 RepID=A0A830FEY3_9EURY|nr:DUF99 family protein [Halocalculus aciditolerans]GGL48564.1 hypothetical protein GCM10009039_03470 [Halocalculus aciditolerans]